MPTAFDVDIELSPPGWLLAADFAALGLSLRSYREPLQRAVREVVSPSIRRNFDLGGRPPWQPLAPQTVKEKTRLNKNSGILVRSGLLQRVAGQLNVWQFTTDSAQVVQLPRAEYGAVHQFGGGYIPARPFMEIQPEDEEKIDEVFQDWIGERLARVGFLSTGGLLGAE